MAFKKWEVALPDKALAKRLSEDESLCENYDIDAFVSLIAVARGYTDAAELEELFCHEPLLCDPHELIDIEIAAEALNEAINNDCLIAVFGDYDCDGVTATAIVYDYLVSRSARVVTYIPDRVGEGYGMNKSAVDKLCSMGVELIVTVDNGIACAEEIAYAAQLGIKTIVTDHHLPPEVLPEAVAVVDPHRVDCPSSFKEICGAEVAFKLICVAEDKEPEQMLSRYADLLCIATVGDVMPLINENRAIVREGIKKIRRNPAVGVSALLSVAGIKRENIDAQNVSFGLVPRINAAGRMGLAERAFKLLTASDMVQAIGIANELDGENAARQQIERTILNESCAAIEREGLQYHRVIVVEGEGWHQGVVGIVASRIVEKYGKPAIVLSCHDGVAEGSGRSISGFSLYEALSACSQVLSKFGGHELAAGLGLPVQDVGEFRRIINEYAVTKSYPVPRLKLDLKLNPEKLSVDMADALGIFEPFGFGNPVPVFGIFGMRLDRIDSLSAGKHLKLLLSKNETPIQALLFGVRPEQFCFEIGDVLDLAVTISANEYNGLRSLSVQIKALKMSGTDDDRLFRELGAYHDYIAGFGVDRDMLAITRSEIGEVYRIISKKPISPERLKHICISSPGFSATQTAVEVLKELGLVNLQKGMLTAVSSASKTDLELSSIYRELKKEGNL